MNEITYTNNIKERLFEKMNKEELGFLLQELVNSIKDHSHLWYDINYIDSCLELFFIYFDKIQNPLPLFYSFFKNHNPPISNLKQKNFLNNINNFIYNDIGITENDFNIYQSIIIYCSFVHLPFKDSVLFCGISQDIPKGIKIKKKGSIDTTKIKDNLPLIVSKLYERSEDILYPDIKTLYTKQVDYIMNNFEKFSVR